MRDDQGSMDHAQGIEEKELTDFERYLLDRLLNSGEDCCGKLCAFDKKTELCAAILPGGRIDDAVCYRGIRKHYEAQGERPGGGNTFFIEKNMRGAWVVYGAIGVRQYYGYTKAEALAKYNEECANTVVHNVKILKEKGE